MAISYRELGSTGVRVSPLCLGAMMFGAWGNADHEESVQIIHAALDAGINFIDTADVYSRGESEEIVGKALAGGRRDSVVLATKVHGKMHDEDPNQFGNTRRWIVQEVENSLRRLKTDWIDLYQIHRPEPDTAIDETLGALSDLVHAGKVRYIGSSTFQPSQIVEAQWVAEKRGRALRLRAAALLAAAPRDRGRGAAAVPPLRHGRDPVEPARRRLAVGQIQRGRRVPELEQARAGDAHAI
jgi:aryl-alcohol dehydrogenase-like predicted oxidoreductase